MLLKTFSHNKGNKPGNDDNQSQPALYEIKCAILSSLVQLFCTEGNRKVVRLRSNSLTLSIVIKCDDIGD